MQYRRRCTNKRCVLDKLSDCWKRIRKWLATNIVILEEVGWQSDAHGRGWWCWAHRRTKVCKKRSTPALAYIQMKTALSTRLIRIEIKSNRLVSKQVLLLRSFLDRLSINLVFLNYFVAFWQLCFELFITDIVCFSCKTRQKTIPVKNV